MPKFQNCRIGLTGWKSIMEAWTIKSGKIRNKGSVRGRTKDVRNMFVEEQMSGDKNKYFEC
jgi:hypothetical protein